MPLPTAQTPPGVYVEEIPSGPGPIQAVGTSVACFLGDALSADAYPNQARAVNNWTEFTSTFLPAGNKQSNDLSNAVYGFFQNGGTRCYIVNTAGQTGLTDSLAAAAVVDEIAIVAAPGLSDVASHEALISHCELLKDRVAILDTAEVVHPIERLLQVETAPVPPPTRSARRAGGQTTDEGDSPAQGGARPRQSDQGFATVYFPWLTVLDPITSALVNVPPSGHMAGIWARVDATRGVAKAPANEPVSGALNLTYLLTPQQQGELNGVGVNCMRLFATEGIRVWGARTLADQSGTWRYLNVRRLFNMIEESIAEGTNWIVFEPNDQTLWKNIRRDIGSFLTRVWRDGGLMGATPEESFFVKCDEETNPQDVIDAGQVVAVIGIAPVKPAEFVTFQIMQSAMGAEITPMPAGG
jgi:phage tail sheath protein FI